MVYLIVFNFKDHKKQTQLIIISLHSCKYDTRCIKKLFKLKQFFQGCANEVTVIRSTETQVYTCQARNKDNNIQWISNSGGIQNVLARCLNGSRTCLTTNSSVSASRTESGRSELMITGRVDGINIECHESSDIEEVPCECCSPTRFFYLLISPLVDFFFYAAACMFFFGNVYCI